MSKLSSTIGSLVDQLFMAREAQRVKNKEADELKSKAYKLERQLLEQFDRDDITGAAGKIAIMSVKTTIEPTIDDFAAIFRFAAKTKNYGIFQRRLNGGAIRELWDEGKKVPGTGKFNREKIYLRKLKR